MNIYYLTAAVLLILLGLVHSVLGERLIIVPILAHEQLPKLLGSRGFMGRVLRFAWHITSVLMWGIGGLLIYWALTGAGAGLDAIIVAITLLASAAISAVIGRLKHFSWWVLLLAGGLVLWGAP